jgi:hypothetical protein
MSDASRDCNSVTFDPDRLTFAEAGSSQEAKRWADSAIRSRECRVRKRMGLVGVRSVRPTKKQIQKLSDQVNRGARGRAYDNAPFGRSNRSM